MTSEVSVINTVCDASQRNVEIQKVLASGQNPVLPFEIKALRRIFDSLVVQQSKNGIELGEAMDVSSETWHDNAAAEMLSAASLVLVTKADQVARKIRDAVNMGYPNKDLGYVTLGSLIHIEYAPGDSEHALLTGVVTELPDFSQFGLPERTEALTIQSPLGETLVGSSEGDALQYPVNGQILSANILEVQQIDLTR